MTTPAEHLWMGIKGMLELAIQAHNQADAYQPVRLPLAAVRAPPERLPGDVPIRWHALRLLQSQPVVHRYRGLGEQTVRALAEERRARAESDARLEGRGLGALAVRGILVLRKEEVRTGEACVDVCADAVLRWARGAVSVLREARGRVQLQSGPGVLIQGRRRPAPPLPWSGRTPAMHSAPR
ncbi:hypothetical protein DFH09DRAFT_1083342 [Mycena vulgaris]|nr:hypothetical protein DFH09DRAFT_1083342 [Mycena vulgaris]